MSEEYLGCGNHSCRFEKPKGMGTNAGCSCLEGVPFERRVKILKAFAREKTRAERAELERDTATRTVENIEGKVAMYDGKRRVAEAALKKAEAERDVLAEALAWGAGRDKKSLFDKLPWFDSRKKWLEWAKQEAGKRGEVTE